MSDSKEQQKDVDGALVHRVVHTPGPWEVSMSRLSVNAEGIRICQHSGPSAASCAVDERLRLQKEANARLIAAAPDMLAALRQIRAELCRRHSPFVVETDYAYINEAIAKATK